MKANKGIFREYDIRGVVGRDIDPDFARLLGRAFAALVHDEQGTDPTSSRDFKIAVGRDCRISSAPLCQALVDGLLEGGVNVVDCGMGPSPQLYFSVYCRNLDGGIQVTGSHNPADQNGFKMMIGKRSISGKDIQRLCKKVEQVRRGEVPCVGGMSMAMFGAGRVYEDELVERSIGRMGKRRLRLVVDSGNGVGGMVGPAVLRRLGCDVVEMYSEPDGHFPNHHPDPSVPENLEDLRARVLSEKADAGIAWDGDADRIAVIDENGEILYGDILLFLLARELLKEIKNPIVLADVKCSERIFSQLREDGAQVVMCRTGHSLIKQQLKECAGHLGGEMSGHLIIAHRYYGIDDAIHAAARLVEILSATELPLSGLLVDLPKVASTPEIRVACSDDIKFTLVEKLKESFSDFEISTIDGVRIRFPSGWGLVRASNTLPLLTLRFEAETEELLSDYRRLTEERIEKVRSELG